MQFSFMLQPNNMECRFSLLNLSSGYFVFSQKFANHSEKHTASVFKPHVYLENNCSNFLRKHCNLQPNCREENNHNLHCHTTVQYDQRIFFVRFVEECNCNVQHMFKKGCELCLIISYYLHIISESVIPTKYTAHFLQIRNAAAAAAEQMTLTSLTCSVG